MNELDKLHIFEEDVPEHVQFNNLRLYDFMEQIKEQEAYEQNERVD